MIITTRRPLVEDLDELVERIRPVEVDEIEAATGSRDVRQVLIEGLGESIESWATRFGRHLACLWGVVANPHDGAFHLGWMLTTDTVERYPKAFMRQCLMHLPHLLERYPVLFNAIDTRHVKALRWARRLGFRLAEPREMGPLGLKFCGFSVRSEDLHVLASGLRSNGRVGGD